LNKKGEKMERKPIEEELLSIIVYYRNIVSSMETIIEHLRKEKKRLETAIGVIAFKGKGG